MSYFNSFWPCSASSRSMCARKREWTFSNSRSGSMFTWISVTGTPPVTGQQPAALASTFLQLQSANQSTCQPPAALASTFLQLQSANRSTCQPLPSIDEQMSKSPPTSMAVACMPTRYLSTSSMPFFLSFTSLYYLDPYWPTACSIGHYLDPYWPTACSIGHYLDPYWHTACSIGHYLDPYWPTACSIGHFKLMSEEIQVTQVQCRCQEFSAKTTQSTIQKLMLRSMSWDSHIISYATENPELGTFWTGKQNKLQNKSRNFFFSFFSFRFRIFMCIQHAQIIKR